MTTVIKEGYSSEAIARLLEKLTDRKKKFNPRKYSGFLKSSINPVQAQNKMRNDWE